MKVNKKNKQLIKALLEDTRPMFDDCMEHLRLRDQAEYERMHAKAVSVGMYS